MITVALRYMVRFSEVTQCAEEQRDVPAATFGELLDHLDQLYPGFRGLLENRGGERHLAVLRRSGQKTRPVRPDEVLKQGDRFGFY